MEFSFPSYSYSYSYCYTYLRVMFVLVMKCASQLKYLATCDIGREVRQIINTKKEIVVMVEEISVNLTSWSKQINFLLQTRKRESSSLCSRIECFGRGQT